MKSHDKGKLKEIHFVTGKGGVGKSTVALALAQEFARSGKKTLLAEIGDRSFFTYLLNLQITYSPVPVCQGLEVAHWSATECLKSYALSLLKVPALYKLLFENPVSRSLIQVAPGLAELAIMGQITSAPRDHGPHGDHEILVIDAFATGHFLNLVKAPQALGKTVQLGPMGEQSREIHRILAQTDLCHLHIVSTPEELPVSESLELMADIKAEFQWPLEVILNKFLQTTLSPDDFKDSEKAVVLRALRDRMIQQEAAESIFLKETSRLRKFPLQKSVKNFTEVETLLRSIDV